MLKVRWRPGWSAGVVAGLALAAVAALVLLGRPGEVRFSHVAHIEQPLPAAPAPPETLRAGPEAERAQQPVGDGPGPAPPDPALLEDGPFGPLPRVGADGRWPFFAYARPFDFQDPRPKIAILVLELGLQPDLMDAALRLPGEVGLQFSPYAPDLAAQFARAREAGHEVLLKLPMEPLDYPASDPGPHTLLAENRAEENLKRLQWLLARAPGYTAVAGSGARFARSARARAILEDLAQRGLALIETGARDLAETAAAVGLPYAATPSPIDADPAVAAIAAALAALETEARAGGSALGVAQGYPVTLERLRLWAATLEDKGLVLAPVSALVIEQSGLSAELHPDARSTATVQG